MREFRGSVQARVQPTSCSYTSHVGSILVSAAGAVIYVIGWVLAVRGMFAESRQAGWDGILYPILAIHHTWKHQMKREFWLQMVGVLVCCASIPLHVGK
jgi:hypothetical protein